jgi:hypothetical protein
MANINPSKGALNRAGQSATQADVGALTAAASVGVPTKTEFDKVVADLATIRTAHNALLAKLKAAGLMASS